jgi:hypothetical protein
MNCSKWIWITSVIWVICPLPQLFGQTSKPISTWTAEEERRFNDSCVVSLPYDSLQQNPEKFCQCLKEKLKRQYSYGQLQLLPAEKLDEVLIACLGDKRKGWPSKLRADFYQDCMAKAEHQWIESPSQYCSCFVAETEKVYPVLSQLYSVSEEVRAASLSKLAVGCLPSYPDHTIPPFIQRKFRDQCLIQAIEQKIKVPEAFCTCQIQAMEKAVKDYRALLSMDGQELEQILSACQKE